MAVGSLLLLMSSLCGAAASVNDSWTAPVSAERLVVWVQSHPEPILRATRVQLVWRRDGLMALRKETPRGELEGIFRETCEQTVDGYAYRLCLDRSRPARGLRDYRLDFRLSRVDGGHCLVTVQVHSDVSLYRARDYEVHNHMVQNLKRVRELFLSIR